MSSVSSNVLLRMWPLRTTGVISVSTTPSQTKTAFNTTYPYPYYDNEDNYNNTQDIKARIVPNSLEVIGSGGYWTHKVGTNNSYGFSSTRAMARMYDGSTLSHNNTKSVGAMTTEYVANLNDVSFVGIYKNRNMNMAVTFTRDTAGTDTRIGYVNDAELFIYVNYTLYDMYILLYASNNTARGSVSSPHSNGASIMEGTEIGVTFTPYAGYYLRYINDTVAGNTSNLNTTEPYTYSINLYATRTITGYFEPFIYQLSLSNSSGGTVSANSSSVETGASSLLTFAPSFAYEVEYFSINGVPHSAAELVNNQYTLSNITSNVSIHAQFRRKSNMQACVGGVLKRLEMYACVNGTLRPIETKFCIGGVLKS